MGDILFLDLAGFGFNFGCVSEVVQLLDLHFIFHFHHYSSFGWCAKCCNGHRNYPTICCLLVCECVYVWQILIKVKTSVVDVVMRFASFDISKSREKQQQQKLKITFVDCWC